jgi:hypothetical protein
VTEVIDKREVCAGSVNHHRRVEKTFEKTYDKEKGRI